MPAGPFIAEDGVVILSRPMVGKRILVKKSSQTRSSQEALFLGYHAFRGAGRAIRKT